MTRSRADALHTAQQSRTLLLAMDNKNSVLAEIAGGKFNPVAYSAYGQQSAQEAVATGLGFNGALREKRIGWYLLGNGYRAYNPTLMRFHSPDSWSPFGGGGLNAYMYCVGDPVNFSDPTGHMLSALKLFKRKKVTRTSSTSSVDQLIPSSPPPAGRRSEPLPSIPEQTTRPHAGGPLDPITGENIYEPLPLDRRNWTKPSNLVAPAGMMNFTEHSALKSTAERTATLTKTPIGPPVNRHLKPTRAMTSRRPHGPENANSNPVTRPLPLTPDETA